MKHTKQIFTTVLSILISVFLVSSAAYAVTTIGTNIETAGTLKVDGSTTTLGDAVADSVILNGRIVTGSAAGAALTLDSTYTRSSGSYLRYNVTDWAGIGSQLDGLYLRAETNVASSGKSLTGLDVYATANDVTTNNLKGILSYAYLKGTSAKTVNTAYGIHGELTFDASSGTNTITTEAAPGLLKITGGVVDTYTKIQGLIIRAGDMDGADRTYGNAILVEDDSDMAGTITWTKGIKIATTCTTGISLEGDATDGILLSGDMTRGIYITGTMDYGIRIGGTTGTAIRIERASNTGPSLHVHSHQRAAGTDEVANDFKGEFLSTSGLMDGIRAQYTMDASNTGTLRTIVANAYLGSTATLSGSGMMYGLLAGVNSVGTVNGSGVEMAGISAGIMNMVGSTLTEVKYLSAISLSSLAEVVPTTGDSQLMLMTHSGVTTLDQVMLIDASDKITNFIKFVDVDGMVSGPSTAASGTPVKIKILVDGTPYYINAYPTSNN